jgi:asparagine synthase (glutamine-hydrolysing)
MFEGIYKLPPAHCVVVTESGARFTRYWSLDYSKTLVMSNDEWIATLRSKLDAAVKRQLVSDVPVGLMLSGGLDSSVLATAMRQELRQPLKTFSIGMVAEGALDERPYARLVAEHVGSEHHEIAISAKDFLDALPAFVWHMDEPVADPASIPLYLLSKLARCYVTVVLSGEGSDEMFGGYPFWTHYKGYARAKWARKIPGMLRNRLFRPLNRYWPKSARLEKYLEMCNLPLATYGRFNPEFQDNVFCEEEKTRLYRRNGHAVPPMALSVEKVRDAYRRAEKFELLDQMLSVSMTQWLPENLLIKADKMAMAHALEVRVPFLDEDVVEFVARMPTDLKIRKSGSEYTVKYALKKAYETALPREIIERQKLGFPVPYARWMKHEMRETVFDILLSKSAREDSLWDTHEVERLIGRALAPDEEADRAVWNPHAKKVWSLLVFEMWKERFGVSVHPQPLAASLMSESADVPTQLHSHLPVM